MPTITSWARAQSSPIAREIKMTNVPTPLSTPRLQTVQYAFACINHRRATNLIKWLGAGGDPNAKNPDISGTPTLLEMSSQKGFDEGVQALLNAGAEANTMNQAGNTPLHLVRTMGAFKALTAAGGNMNAANHQGRSPLMKLLNDHPWGDEPQQHDMVMAMLQNGADVNHRDQQGNTPLHFAIAQHEPQTDIVAALVAAGADVNACNVHGESPLYQTRHAHVCEMLLKFGANINVTNNQGKTFLSHWVEHQQAPMGDDVWEIWQRHGIDVNRVGSNGTSALHTVVTFNRDTEWVQRLVKAGADPNVRNAKGETPLCLTMRMLCVAMHAFDFSHPHPLLLMLVDVGADPSCADDDGNTPWSWLEKWPDDDAKERVRAFMINGERRRLEKMSPDKARELRSSFDKGVGRL